MKWMGVGAGNGQEPSQRTWRKDAENDVFSILGILIGVHTNQHQPLSCKIFFYLPQKSMILLPIYAEVCSCINWRDRDMQVNLLSSFQVSKYTWQEPRNNYKIINESLKRCNWLSIAISFCELLKFGLLKANILVNNNWCIYKSKAIHCGDYSYV